MFILTIFFIKYTITRLQDEIKMYDMIKFKYYVKTKFLSSLIVELEKTKTPKKGPKIVVIILTDANVLALC